MKTKFKKIHLPTIASLWSGIVLTAYSAEPEAQADDPAYAFNADRAVMMSCLAADAPIGNLHFRTWHRPEGQQREYIVPRSTSAPFSMRSTPVEYRGPSRVEFFDEAPPPGPPFDEEGNRVGPKPIAIATLPADRREVLLLFVPLAVDRQIENLKFRTIIYDDSQENLPFGSYRLINFTERPLLALVGDKQSRLPIAPGQASQTVKLQGAKRNVHWQIIDPEISTDRPSYSSMWRFDPGHRTLVFITDSRHQRGALTVKPIVQWKPESQ